MACRQSDISVYEISLLELHDQDLYATSSVDYDDLPFFHREPPSQPSHSMANGSCEGKNLRRMNRFNAKLDSFVFRHENDFVDDHSCLSGDSGKVGSNENQTESFAGRLGPDVMTRSVESAVFRHERLQVTTDSQNPRSRTLARLS